MLTSIKSEEVKLNDHFISESQKISFVTDGSQASYSMRKIDADYCEEKNLLFYHFIIHTYAVHRMTVESAGENQALQKLLQSCFIIAFYI